MRNAIRCVTLAAIVGVMLGCAMADQASAYDGEIDVPGAVDVQPDERDPLEVEAEARQAIGGADFMAQGVVEYGGRTETWYSSQVLYHWRTPEWWTDEEGFYHDADGYYVVAASDYAEGSIIETSRGLARVLDGGCDAGVTDFYTCF